MNSPAFFIRRHLRVFRVGLVSAMRNYWLALASISILFMALVAALIGMASYQGFNAAIGSVERDLGISVFLLDGASDEDRQQLQDDLNASPKVYEVKYRSKDEALELFKKTHEGSESDALKGTDYTGNVFPASFEIKMDDLDHSDWVVEFVSQDQYSDVVESALIKKNQQEAIDAIKSLQDGYAVASVVVGAVFAIVAMIVVFNTVRITIFNRSKEVEVMKLLGAPRSFIRQPFVVEAAIYGAIAAALASVFAVVTMRIVPERLNEGGVSALSGIAKEATDFVSAEFNDNSLLIIGLLFAASILVSVVTSRLALHKYLSFRNW